MQVGLLDKMENGLLVPIHDDMYIQLIIREEEEEVSDKTEENNNGDLDASHYNCQSNNSKKKF
jgi:hypothetical protein